MCEMPISEKFREEFKKTNGVTFRGDSTPEKIGKFRGHKGDCKYCDNGIVKMSRNPISMFLEPNDMSCLLCGQQYFYSDKDLSPEELVELDIRLWREKGEDND